MTGGRVLEYLAMRMTWIPRSARNELSRRSGPPHAPLVDFYSVFFFFSRLDNNPSSKAATQDDDNLRVPITTLPALAVSFCSYFLSGHQCLGESVQESRRESASHSLPPPASENLRHLRGVPSDLLMLPSPDAFPSPPLS